jgi:uncharacterized protein involved in exopolysaccharide biosynthesis
MELNDYLAITFKRRWIIIECFLIMTITVIIGSFIQRPIYESSVKILIEQKVGNSSLLSGLAAGDALSAISRTGSPLETQMEIIKTDPILNAVIERMNLTDKKGMPLKAAALRGQIDVSALRMTDIIQVQVQSTDPNGSAAIANTLGDVFVESSQQSNQREAGMARKFIEEQLMEVKKELSGAEVGPGKGVNILQSKRLATVSENTYIMLLQKLEDARIAEAVKIGYARIIEPATTPISPVKPKKARNAMTGAFFGIIMGTTLAFLFEYLDDSIKSAEDVKNLLDLPVLGMIPHFVEEETTRRSGSRGNWWADIPIDKWKKDLVDLKDKLYRKVKKDEHKA